MFYYQCYLKQDNKRLVSYIEEKGAKIGAFVEIPELGGFWEVLGIGHKTDKINTRAYRDFQGSLGRGGGID